MSQIAEFVKFDNNSLMRRSLNHIVFLMYFAFLSPNLLFTLFRNDLY